MSLPGSTGNAQSNSYPQLWLRLYPLSFWPWATLCSLCFEKLMWPFHLFSFPPGMFFPKILTCLCSLFYWDLCSNIPFIMWLSLTIQSKTASSFYHWTWSLNLFYFSQKNVSLLTLCYISTYCFLCSRKELHISKGFVLFMLILPRMVFSS